LEKEFQKSRKNDGPEALETKSDMALKNEENFASMKAQ
jgi:hypothetical protein